MKKMKLGDVFKLSSGKSLPEKKRTPGNHNVYGGNGITGNHNDYFVEKPTIVIGRVGEYCGAVHLTTEKCWITDNALMVTEWYQEVDKQYLVYFLNAMNLHQYAKTVGQPSISQANVYGLDINLPLIEQQQEIVKILNLVSKVIIDREEELKRLDNLIKARFVELFGDPNIEFKYESHKFKEFASDMTKGPFGSDMKKDLFVPKGEDTYKVYIQANAIQGDQNIGDYYISKDYFDSKIFRFEVHPGDYIITCDGTLGKHLKLSDEMEKGVISPSLLRLTLNEEKMTSEYFEYLWDMYMLLLMKKEARNACLVHLPSAKVIGEIDIPVPPFTMQKEFSRFVEQTDKSKVAVQKALDEAQLLFDSLMQKYFG